MQSEENMNPSSLEKKPSSAPAGPNVGLTSSVPSPPSRTYASPGVDDAQKKVVDTAKTGIKETKTAAKAQDKLNASTEDHIGLLTKYLRCWAVSLTA